ncbi:hypothetical protein Pyrfu_1615 [Pyrolobus fumarii 1A]|uniref:PEGA domain protein n=1 Tax=Pyrolobus fumarii (strain DSM 11204 / 1A) TaxID=694429 RepID=G0ECA2_PYRF1|nr:carboxypeptidase regulatory-like domain-containing protein [Pyrolobus fumarii]AEM39472.1 hypothetical protein Pyrfu_1615 [Pyrolobus fumarii 1A]
MKAVVTTLLIVVMLAVACATVTDAESVNAVVTLCPGAHTPTVLPPHLSSVELSGIVDDAVVTLDKLVVAFTNGTIGLYTLEGQPLFITDAGVIIDRLVPLAPGMIVGIGHTPQATVDNTIVILKICGPECIVINGIYSLHSEPIYIGMDPEGKIIVVDVAGYVYTFSGSSVTPKVERIWNVTNVAWAKLITWCGRWGWGIAYNVYSGGNDGNVAILLQRQSDNKITLLDGYKAYDAAYNVYTATLYVLAARPDADNLYLVIWQTGYEPSVKPTEISAPSKAWIVQNRGTVLAVLYYTSAEGFPTYTLQAFDITSGEPRLLWSIPLPGELQRLYAIPACNPRYLLVVARDNNDNLVAYLVDAVSGRPLWNMLVGITLGQAEALGYNEGWFTAKSGSKLYVMKVASLLKPLYAVEFGVLLDGRPVPYNITITCLGGECRGVLTRYGYSLDGFAWILLPTGTYRVEYSSVYAGVYNITIRVLPPNECLARHVHDPPSVIEVKSVNVTICVYGAGDPQGWGFAKGPIKGAEVKLKADFGFRRTVITGNDGCVSLKVPPGRYNVTVSAIGYKECSKELVVGENNEPIIVNFELEPLLKSVSLNVYALDTRQPLRDASVTIIDESTKRKGVAKAFEVFMLPPGNYTIIVTRPLYQPRTVKVEIPLSTTRQEARRIPVYLPPQEFTVELIVHLQMPLKHNATMQLVLTRLEPVKAMPIRVERPIPAGETSLRIKVRVIWGYYEVRVSAPLHKTAILTMDVPNTLRLHVNLTMVHYNMRVIAIDALTRQVVENAKVIAETVGYKAEFPAGALVSLPLGNYTITVEADYYKPGKRSVILNQNTELKVLLEPVEVPVTIQVKLGKRPAPNATVEIVGVAFNGISVTKRITTDDKGVATITLMPGNYTARAIYRINIFFLSMELVKEKSFEVEKSVNVDIVLPESPALIIMHLLPYLLIGSILVIVALVFIVARRALRERIRKLRESLAERFGRTPPGIEEELEELF